jgi:hypothetical protein
MYKHAIAFKGWRHLPDTRDDEMIRRSQRASAGVEPRASKSFVIRTKIAIIFCGNYRRRDYVRLAHQLNTYGKFGRKFDAKGQFWTHSSLKTFMDAFLPAVLPYSN